jgi:ketosteroid isomerase-like protein
MHENSNVEVVKQAFAEFKRGDIPAVLSCLGTNVQWNTLTGLAGKLPMAGSRHGLNGVRDYFRILAEQVTIEEFEPQHYVAQGDRVVALGHYRMTIRRNGRHFASDWAMVFTVRDGKILSFTEFTDSAGLREAWEAQKPLAHASAG